MDLWHENTFRIADPLCGDYTGDGPLTRAGNVKLCCYPEYTLEQTAQVTSPYNGYASKGKS